MVNNYDCHKIYLIKSYNISLVAPNGQSSRATSYYFSKDTSQLKKEVQSSAVCLLNVLLDHLVCKYRRCQRFA